MNIHLIDGTYELFRHHFGAPSATDASGREVGGMRGVLASLLGMLERGVTHMAVATDHVIESFRNDLWPGYKTGAGIDPALLAQFHPLEDALTSMGVQVWAMKELEADDGLASGAARARRDRRVERVYICTPDKDLSQCVVGDRVSCSGTGGRGRCGTSGGSSRSSAFPPRASRTTWLWWETAQTASPAFRGGERSRPQPCWPGTDTSRTSRGARTGGTSRIRGAKRLAATLGANRAAAFLFRDLATLRDGAALFEDVDELQWRGPTDEFRDVTEALGASGLWTRAERLKDSRFGSS